MTVNGLKVAMTEGMTVLDAARQVGVVIPVLCHRDGISATGGCGVCMVEDVATGRLLPACAAQADPEMVIETESSSAVRLRRAALEMLLGHHPADCEAPCQLACPSGLPVQTLMARVVARDWDGARALACAYPFACDGKAPCEKACRRQPLGGAVAICVIHRWLAERGAARGSESRERKTLPPFRSRMRGVPEERLLALAGEKGERRLAADAREVTEAEAAYEAGRCLRCGCLRPDDCRLREVCAAVGAKQPVGAEPDRMFSRQQTPEGFRFDASRCVLCGLCVRTAQSEGVSLAPAFHGRGFDLLVGPPVGRTWADVPESVLKAAVAVCPTGAMAWRDA